MSKMTDLRPIDYSVLFCRATDSAPFPFQISFARNLPSLVNVPTGMGKTAMAVLGWLWRRRFADQTIRETTPRRLVYCLPMRVLVEQACGKATEWINNLQIAGLKPEEIPIHVLMGGEAKDDWDIHPERDAIIIGTQDMLLSRALNRGYAASRARWPMQYGLLHTDCLWVFDEIQLMGAGLATTAQLEAFRRLLPEKDSGTAKSRHGCRSVWMSATLRPDWLKTVDFKDRVDGLSTLELNDDDLQNEEIQKRWQATKKLEKADALIGDMKGLTRKIFNAHEHGTRTIVIVNTVKRACELFEALNAPSAQDAASDKKSKPSKRKSSSAPDPTAEVTEKSTPKVVLLHSRFRPGDRKERVDEAFAEIHEDQPGTIVVSTQVIEAGVDVSATTLFTELAPWASLVQRFGRCNRKGEDDGARVLWIDLPNKAKDQDAKPYELDQLTAARSLLEKCSSGVGPAALEQVAKANRDDFAMMMRFEHTHVIRRKDLIDLFDTTSDLAGNDIDIDRYVREIEETDVRVFWRAWEGDAPPEEEPAPRREELCPAPIGSERNPGFRQFAENHSGKVWRWHFLERQWEKADASRIAPGQVYLIHVDAGGYASERGWTGKSDDKPTLDAAPQRDDGRAPDSNDDDSPSRIGAWQTIAEHTSQVCAELDRILASLSVPPDHAEALRRAARWHDWGKAHEVFQRALPDGAPDPSQSWAKARGVWKRYDRRHFRHELASALGVLQQPSCTTPAALSDADLDLVAYLIAAHHGKVRMSIRSLPNECWPEPQRDENGRDRRFARGVWDGDHLPETDLGGGVTATAVKLSLEPMELGLCEQEPFVGQPSWAERMIGLRDALGPFRLSYLEALLRAADIRASAAAEKRGAEQQTGARQTSSPAQSTGMEATRG